MVQDFYEPCMATATRYDRAVGYFSSQGLALAARGIHKLLGNDGRMRLVASPILEADDLEAIAEGYRLREDRLATLAERSLRPSQELPEVLQDRLNAIAWLVSIGRLEIKLAIRVDGEGKPACGLYHEKIGVFRDADGDLVAFTGSSNETSGGLVDNFESIRVLRSWDGTAALAVEIQNDFIALWGDRTPGARILEFTAMSKELLARYRKAAPPNRDAEDPPLPATLPRRRIFAVPEDRVLHLHQEKARTAWAQAGGRGIFQMATGAGKTIAALATAAWLAERLPRAEHHLAFILIICPYRHLVTQWRDEARRFGLEALLAFESRHCWYADLHARLIASASRRSVDDHFLPELVIVCNATLEGDHFQDLMKLLPCNTMVIADECHHLGSRQMAQALPTRARYRLGLSATPARWFDDAGTGRLYDYFGQPLEPVYDLAQALAEKVLTPYTYEPIVVRLEPDEADEYRDLSTRIARLFAANADLEDERLKTLLLRRSRLVALARNKLTVLRQIVEPERRQLHHALIYCGEGTGINEPDPMIRQIEHLLAEELGLRIATYTAETALAQREGIRHHLDSGVLQAVVAMRCLDEGVDIPSVQTAIIMASTTNPRQFIQRRGRVLRRSPGKVRARIVDLVVCPPADAVVDEATRGLLRSELKRIEEFSSLAVNYGEVQGRLVPIRKEYEVWDA